MKKERNKDNIRQVNTAMVLNTLRRNNCQMSRPDLAEQVGLSKVTIASIIRTLNNLGLTNDAGLGRPDHRGGRKPLLVTLDTENKRIVSLRLSSDGAEMLLSDITGRELSRLRSGYGGDPNPDRKPAASPRPDELAAMVRRLAAEGGASLDSITGLVITGEGLGPSEDNVFDYPDGDWPASDQAPEVQNESTAWAAELGRLLKMPVSPVRLAAARAFGEHWYNDEIDQQSDFFYLDLDLDLEAVVFRDGLPGDVLPGFGAVCLSHPPYGSENFPVETAQSVLSGTAFLKQASESQGRPVTFSELSNQATKGDESALSLFENYGYQLGCALALAVNLSSLRKIVIGGFMTRAWSHFSPALRLGLDRHLHQRYRGLVTVTPLRDDLEDGLMGSLALALDKWIYHTSLLSRD